MMGFAVGAMLERFDLVSKEELKKISEKKTAKGLKRRRGQDAIEDL